MKRATIVHLATNSLLSPPRRPPPKEVLLLEAIEKAQDIKGEKSASRVCWPQLPMRRVRRKNIAGETNIIYSSAVSMSNPRQVRGMDSSSSTVVDFISLPQPRETQQPIRATNPDSASRPAPKPQAQADAVMCNPSPPPVRLLIKLIS
ncbi:uncharacterized protein P884DRAFT_254692 [Thermothelomyces heterothallicus CBS 202.75]|uniref:uncharacterized protein n=1 Tax=Thermothelomyces heterothallicus CBS 202.75 TaxID=1149848 RepID=UPI0037449CFA